MKSRRLKSNLTLESPIAVLTYSNLHSELNGGIAIRADSLVFAVCLRPLWKSYRLTSIFLACRLHIQVGPDPGYSSRASQTGSKYNEAVQLNDRMILTAVDGKVAK